MNIQSVVVDTSVLCMPVDRRFAMAAWERLGETVPVLPRVVHELYGVMAVSEQKHWDRVLDGEERRGEATYSEQTRYAIGEAVMAGTRQWVIDELDSQFDSGRVPEGGALRVNSLTEAQAVQARGIARRIPAFCFSGTKEHEGDRAVIAEAITAGYTVLASDNFSSIRPIRLNSWVQREFGLREKLIRNPDEVVLDLHEATGNDPDEEALKAVLLATLPGRRVRVDREEQIVDQFLTRLRGFSDTAEGARSVWEGPKGGALAEQIRENLSGSVARDTEQRRITLVRDYAQEAGWAAPVG